jgi:hypothetical protein
MGGEGRVSFQTWQVGKRGIPLEQQLLLQCEAARAELPPLLSRTAAASSR